MKKVLGIILVVALVLATMGLAVGCGSEPSDFERAEQLVNEAFESLEEIVDALQAMMGGDADFGEIVDRLDAFEDELAGLFDRIEAEFDALDLTEAEEDRIEDMAEDKLDALMDRMTEIMADLLG